MSPPLRPSRPQKGRALSRGARGNSKDSASLPSLSTQKGIIKYSCRGDLIFTEGKFLENRGGGGVFAFWVVVNQVFI